MGLFKKFRDAWFAPMSFDSLDDDFYDRLEESLILADVGMDVALDATEKLRRRAYDDRLLTADQVKGALREILADWTCPPSPASFWSSASTAWARPRPSASWPIS